MGTEHGLTFQGEQKYETNLLMFGTPDMSRISISTGTCDITQVAPQLTLTRSHVTWSAATLLLGFLLLMLLSLQVLLICLSNSRIRMDLQICLLKTIRAL